MSFCNIRLYSEALSYMATAKLPLSNTESNWRNGSGSVASYVESSLLGADGGL